MKDKDHKMIQEAYSRVLVKEDDDTSGPHARYYDEGRARNTYSMDDLEFEFKHIINGKEYIISANLDYEVEDPGEDAAWEWHDFIVNSIAYQDPHTGEYVDVNPQQQPELFKQLEQAATDAFQTDSDNWTRYGN
jgi:hypothetical protein